ncbi:hypothetical protein C456_07822 [Haloferax volcanii DSM 14919]|uniref:Uncharacterized protein n=1 Tax=Haloferax lucentense (strain DSM 14919 / JCM 9276 / NCIMB 13854 / Aa 2.2) TaxID=1230452 RepID=M0GUE8_HALL2|nr:hypothetical protein [Haloferax lucentense]ELZ75152.1 hypothetical protein C456_07822 [Haloferax lucentense DSM 14919]
MSLIDFIRSVEESQDEFDVELEEFDADSEQEAVDDDTSGGRSWGRLLLVALLLVGVAYAVSRLRSSSGDSFTDIALADDPAEGDSAADEETGAGDDASDEETDADDDGAVEVEIESPGDDGDDEE